MAMKVFIRVLSGEKERTAADYSADASAAGATFWGAA